MHKSGRKRKIVFLLLSIEEKKKILLLQAHVNLEYCAKSAKVVRMGLTTFIFLDILGAVHIPCLGGSLCQNMTVDDSF